MTQLVSVFGAPGEAAWSLVPVSGRYPSPGAAELTLHCAPRTPVDSDQISQWIREAIDQKAAVLLRVVGPEGDFSGRWTIDAVTTPLNGPWLQMTVSSRPAPANGTVDTPHAAR